MPQSELTIICPAPRLSFRNSREKKIRLIANGSVDGYWDLDGMVRRIPKHVAANAIQVYDDFKAHIHRRDNVPAHAGYIEWDDCEPLREERQHAHQPSADTADDQ